MADGNINTMLCICSIVYILVLLWPGLYVFFIIGFWLVDDAEYSEHDVFWFKLYLCSLHCSKRPVDKKLTVISDYFP